MSHRRSRGIVKDVLSSSNALAQISQHQGRLTGDLHQALRTICSARTLMLALEETMNSLWGSVQKAMVAYSAPTASADTSDKELLNVKSAPVLL